MFKKRITIEQWHELTVTEKDTVARRLQLVDPIATSPKVHVAFVDSYLDSDHERLPCLQELIDLAGSNLSSIENMCDGWIVYHDNLESWERDELIDGMWELIKYSI